MPINPPPRLQVQRAAALGLDLVWDQHVGGMSPNAPYNHSRSYSAGFYEMGIVTKQWQAEAGWPNMTGVRTVVFEENGEPGWKRGTVQLSSIILGRLWLSLPLPLPRSRCLHRGYRVFWAMMLTHHVVLIRPTFGAVLIVEASAGLNIHDLARGAHFTWA